MKHHARGRSLGRVKNKKEALLKGLARALIMNGKVRTTEAKAKELRPFVERLITVARPGTLSARRLVAKRLGSEKEALKQLVDVVAPKYKDRKGGYTRITKIAPRKRDASPMAIIELV